MNHITMNTYIAVFGFAAALIGGTGCSPSGGRSGTVMEGVVFSVEYQRADGMKISVSRRNRDIYGNPTEVHGRLTPDFLILTRPRLKNSTAEVIPVSRLISLEFGEGGIKYEAGTKGTAKPSVGVPVKEMIKTAEPPAEK
jgi:hypothetical protein